MKKLMALICILAGVGVLAIQLHTDSKDRVYVYPPDAKIEAAN